MVQLFLSGGSMNWRVFFSRNEGVFWLPSTNLPSISGKISITFLVNNNENFRKRKKYTSSVLF